MKLCLHAQNTGSGWRYGIKPGENDTSVTGWMVLALKTAKNAKLDIPKEDFQTAFARRPQLVQQGDGLERQDGLHGARGRGLAAQRGLPGAVPLLEGALLHDRGGRPLPALRGREPRVAGRPGRGQDPHEAHAAKWQEQKGRSLSTINMYYWYYGSYALFQYGGPDWKRWNEDMKKVLLETQRQGQIDEDGSWDPIDEWGAAGGRVYSTAICAMTLEVYYRFMRLQGKGF